MGGAGRAQARLIEVQCPHCHITVISLRHRSAVDALAEHRSTCAGWHRDGRPDAGPGAAAPSGGPDPF